MDANELLSLIERGETSTVQFKDISKNSDLFPDEKSGQAVTPNLKNPHLHLVNSGFSNCASLDLEVFRDALKSNVHDEQSIAQEMVAFANSQGGKILIVSFSATLLPYSGPGSGIKRSLEDQPNIEFYNDIDGEQFKVVIPRPVKN
jgi:hypothetical protein